VNNSAARARKSRELIAALADLFPGAFSVYQHRRRPLKVGIDRDLAAALSDAMNDTELRLALGSYCRNIGYLQACREGAERVGLDGKRVGQVTASEAAHAKEQLAQAGRHRSNKNQVGEKPNSAPVEQIKTGADTPRRVSLTDLRAAAARRKGTA
jgi:ProP effector